MENLNISQTSQIHNLIFRNEDSRDQPDPGLQAST